MVAKNEENARQFIEGLRRLEQEHQATFKVVHCSLVEADKDASDFLKVVLERLGSGAGVITETVFINLTESAPSSLDSLRAFIQKPSVLQHGTPASGIPKGPKRLLAKERGNAATP